MFEKSLMMVSLAKTLLIAMALTSSVIIMLYMIALVEAERDPGITVHSLTVDQISVSPSRQLMVRTKVSIRKGCIARVARGFVRPTPGTEDSMDVQLITNAPLVVGLSLSDLHSSISATQGPVEARHKTITYREFIPVPSDLEPGGNWRYAEFISQAGCGWLHGLLPLDTSIIIGPPVQVSAAH